MQVDTGVMFVGLSQSSQIYFWISLIRYKFHFRQIIDTRIDQNFEWTVAVGSQTEIDMIII